MLRKRAVDCGVKTPMAVCKYDAGRPFPAVGPFFPPGPWLNFHVIQESAAIWTLPGIMTEKDAELHCGSQDDFSAHFMDSGSDDLVPCGFGAKRGLDPFQHIRRALQQVHPHASMQAVLEPKLDAVAKFSGFEKIQQNWMKSERTGCSFGHKGFCSYKVNVAAGFKVHLKP